jgi:DNA modification methylase
MSQQQLGLFDHLTHRANLKHTRYGWLRLTPAYSVHLVAELLTAHATNSDAVVLDPFCGTGTTALVCAEQGIPATTSDINPFLLWLTRAKTRAYSERELAALQPAARQIGEQVAGAPHEPVWTPPLHQIEKWWDAPTLTTLSHLMQAIHNRTDDAPGVTDLLKIAFCRVMITHSNASFHHQSMSFKPPDHELRLTRTTAELLAAWHAAIDEIHAAARSSIVRQPRVLHGDARQLTTLLPPEHYTCVITSPPYPNRMSYIRELRPYMYWLDYLKSGREAGELDWQAIGGTWGCATSNVGKWEPPVACAMPYPDFPAILAAIAARSDILARYVHKYFYDMAEHTRQIFRLIRPGGTVHYVVGNSRFYDVLLPVEEIFAALLQDAGFVEVTIRPIRKRTSKKELYEFVVAGKKG